MLSIPEYISKVSPSMAPITFEWNDANPAGGYAHEVVPLQNKIAKLSKRAIVGFSAACAEWVVFRFATIADISEPLEYIEAVWAAVNDWQYLLKIDAPNLESEGPEKGPLWTVVELLRKTSRQAERLEPIAYRAVCISNLAEYVLPDSKHFQKWRKAVLDRIFTLYLLDPQNKLGPPVPREAYDPGFDFKVEMAPDLIAKFLGSLDFSKNPYLKEP